MEKNKFKLIIGLVFGAIIGFAFLVLALMNAFEWREDFYFGGSWGGVGRNYIISGDAPPIENVEELTDFADHVIRGKVLDNRVEWVTSTITREKEEQRLLAEGWTNDEIDEMLYGLNWESSDPSLMTIYRIYVQEVFQGSHTVGDIIELRRVGGEKWYVQWILENGTELSIESEYILFLYSWEWAGFADTLVHSYQGAYYVPSYVGDTKITALKDGDLEVELISVDEWDHIVITLKDLVEIAEENNIRVEDDIMMEDIYLNTLEGTVVAILEDEVLFVAQLNLSEDKLERTSDEWLASDQMSDIYRLVDIGSDVSVGTEIRISYAITTMSIPPLVPVVDYEII